MEKKDEKSDTGRRRPPLRATRDKTTALVAARMNASIVLSSDSGDEGEDAYTGATAKASRKRSAPSSSTQPSERASKRRRTSRVSPDVISLVSPLAANPRRVLNGVPAGGEAADELVPVSVYLPDEILTLVFDFGQMFGARIRAASAQVDKQWNRVLMQPRYHDVFVNQLYFMSPYNNNHGNHFPRIRHNTGIDLEYFKSKMNMSDDILQWNDAYRLTKLMQAAAKHISVRDSVLSVYDDGNHEIAKFEYRNRGGPHHYWLEFVKASSVDGIFSSFAYFAPVKGKHTACQFHPHDASLVSMSVDLCINVRKLDAFLARNVGSTEVVCAPGLIDCLYEVVSVLNLKSLQSGMFSNALALIGKGAAMPRWSQVMWEPPEVMRADFAMHPHQIATMSWMQSIEKKAHDNALGVWFPAATPILLGGCSFALRELVIHRGTCTHINECFQEKTPTSKMNYEPIRGGVLADEMGLGKTITAVANALVARPAMPVSLLGGNAIMEVAWDAVLDRESAPVLLVTRATLVVLPSHLVLQWRNEIDKFAGLQHVNVITLTTKLDHVAVSYGDIMRADFVLVSKSFLLNRDYYARLLAPLSKLLDTRDRSAKAARQLEEKRSHANLADERGPLLELFNWQRLIVDEGHEVLTPVAGAEDHLLLILQLFSTPVRWYMSGTPFPSLKALMKALLFLRMPVALLGNPPQMGAVNAMLEFERDQALKKPIVMSGDASNTVRTFSKYFQLLNFLQIFVRKNVWRNTKQSLAGTFALPPPFTMQLEAIDFSAVERVAYNSGIRSMSMLCSEPLGGITNSGEFDTGRLERLRLSILAQLEHRFAESGVAEVELQQRLERKLRYLQEFFETHGFENPADDALYCSETAIFLDDYPNVRLDGVTMANCIAERDRLTEDLHELRGQRRADREGIDTLTRIGAVPSGRDIAATERIRNAFGSKAMGLLVFISKTLAENPENRLLVFSRSDNMMAIVKLVIEHGGVESAMMGANIHAKNKAIREFTTTNSAKRVFLLNSNTSAAGLNLVEATHVILVDPSLGNPAESSATDLQAISRAHRQGQTKNLKVVRFLIRDTQESERVRFNSADANDRLY